MAGTHIAILRCPAEGRASKDARRRSQCFRQGPSVGAGLQALGVFIPPRDGEGGPCAAWWVGLLAALVAGGG